MSWLVLMRMVGRFRWLVVLTVVVAAGSSAFWTLRQTPTYTVSTTLVVWPNESETGRDVMIRSLETLDRRTVIATYAKMPSSVTVQERARQQLKLPAEQFRRYRTRTSVLPDTNILRISVEGPDPSLVAAVANATAEQANDYVKSFSGLYRMTVLDPAHQPTAPVRQDVSRSLGTGAVVGLFLGVGWIFVFESIRRLKHASRAQDRPLSEEAISALSR